MTGVDDAYHRYVYLTDALGRLLRVSLSNPLSEEILRLGLTEAGDSRRQAEAKIENRLAETRRRLSALAFLDMCTAFETDCRERIPTAIGEAERVVRKHYDVRVMELVRVQLVRQADDFRSLEAIFKIVEQHISGDGPEKLRRLRKRRNRAAHGDMGGESDPPTLEEARETLNEVLALICNA